MKKNKHWTDGLTARTANIIKTVDDGYWDEQIREKNPLRFKSKDGLRNALENRILAVLRVPNLGKKSLSELRAFCDLEPSPIPKYTDTYLENAIAALKASGYLIYKRV